MDRLKHDLFVALRGFRRTPTFAIAVLTILGLGIGMAVAMFTTFHAILIRRLPVEDQDRIAVLWPYQDPTVELSPPATDLRELRLASRTMRDVAGVAHWAAAGSPFVDGDRGLVLNQRLVTSNYFDVLGTRPVVGRLLRPEDEAPGAPAVMVVSYGVWRSQFGGSSSVVGRQIVDPNSHGTYTIVGVAPLGLDYPVGVGCWTPIARGTSPRVFAVARLARGTSISAARAEFLSIITRLEPALKLKGATALTFTQAVLGDVRPTLVVVTAAVALLLLIACVNVGNLFLVRAASRTGELVIRRALGASYVDLARHLSVEGALLAIAGGAFGFVCAAALVRAFVVLAPPQLPRLDEVRLHGNLLSIAIGVTAFCVLLFSLLPAVAAARPNLASPLRLDARAGAVTARRRRLRDWLVGSQVALALVTLAGAGLLGRSLLRLEHLELGYRADHLLIGSIAFDRTKYASPEKALGWGEQVGLRIRAIPGVTAVTPILMLPFVGPSVTIAEFEAEGQTSTEFNENPMIPFETAGAEYFLTFDTRLLRGRTFVANDREHAPDVAIVSESVARRFWPGQDPIGRRIRFAPFEAPGVPKSFFDWRMVVGVVPDTRYRSLRETSAMVYVPWRQFPGWFGNFALRSSGDVGGLMAAMKHEVKAVDPTLALWDVRTMDEVLSGPLAEPRFIALLLAAFSTVALVLAAVGLYGTMALTVREQTREIGIRLAIGASAADIRTAVLRKALVIAAAGIFFGLVGAIATTRLLGALLFNVSPTDPATLAGVCALLLIVALVAAYLPARRAMRIDVIHALRAE
jgi:predicted permease